jgi:hypothetical protein
MAQTAEHISFSGIFIKLLDLMPEDNCYLFTTVIQGGFYLHSETFLNAMSADEDKLKKLNKAPELEFFLKNYSNIEKLMYGQFDNPH